MAGMSSDEEFAELVRVRMLAAFGLKPWEAGLAAVPLRVRVWRVVTFACRRGRAIDWRSYNRAEETARAADEAYRAALPDRLDAIAEHLTGMLPEGLRFEWTVDGEQ
jgi:hypothetical protein